MPRMMRRMGRAVVGTAVVAGTAGAVHHHQEQKYAAQAAEQQGGAEASNRPPTSRAPLASADGSAAPAAPAVDPTTAQLGPEPPRAGHPERRGVRRGWQALGI
jgi:hypothetical protein